MNTVFSEIGLKPFYIFRQSEINQCLAALNLAFFNKAVTVNFGKVLCVLNYIPAVIRVLGHFNTVLIQLEITQLKRKTEFIDLVSGVVYIKLTLRIISCRFKNRSETVSERAAARVSDVHRSGRIS